MKKFIMATVIAACIALCAAVWPQSKAPEETPVSPPIPAVCAPEEPAAELKTTPQAEKEKEVVPPTEVSTEIPAEPQPAPSEAPVATQVQPTPESEMASEAVPEPAPEPTLEPPADQPTQSGDVVYVEGFGWIEIQGPNRVEYAVDMYENGNKIGIMG